MMMINGLSFQRLRNATVAAMAISASLLIQSGLADTEMSLNQAYDKALNHSSQGQMIRDDLEVAEQKYFAERINFYLPEISLNGSLPSYTEEESFRFFGASSQRQLFKTRDIDLTTNIQLEQSLYFGGDLTLSANLVRSDARYPNTASPGEFIDELTERGFFDLRFQQPILQPSEKKNALYNSETELEIARLDRHTEAAGLKKEVTEAFFGVLQSRISLEIKTLALQSARLQAEIDSAKFEDGVASEETKLESSSSRLDAELELIDIENQVSEQNRALTSLLDMPPTETIEPTVPVVEAPPDEQRRKHIVGMWSESIPIQKAVNEYEQAKRAADFSASSKGLNATVDANYSLGRGNVETSQRPDQEINTNSWGVALNFTFPIWDGGSSSAEVKAARLEAERARLEYQQARRSAQAEIVNLINQIEVNYRKIQVLDQKVEIERNKLAIAESRWQDGQISELTYLEARISFLESRETYVEELKKYRLSTIDLDSKFLTDVT